MNQRRRKKISTRKHKRTKNSHYYAFGSIILLCFAVTISLFLTIPITLDQNNIFDIVSVAGTIGSISFIVLSAALWNGKRDIGRGGAAVGWLATSLLLIAATIGLFAVSLNAVPPLPTMALAITAAGLGTLTIFILVQVKRIDEE